jgi:hypothetical protein
MRYSSATVVAWFLLIAVPAHTQVPATFDRDTVTCGTWTEAHEITQSPLAAGLESWVLGYVTGYGNTDNRALIAWISHYCQAYPSHPVATAASELILEQFKQTLSKR